MMKRNTQESRRGSATIGALVLMLGLASLSMSLLAVVSSSFGERRTEHEELTAKLAAEAGMAEAIFRLQTGSNPVLGNENAPIVGPSGSYWVEQADLGNDRQSLTCTGIGGEGAARIEVILEEQNGAFFTWAAFGQDGLTMDSNAKTDSYDSTLGSYDSQDVNGNGAKKYALSNGDVGSNADITVDSNVKVHGSITPGPNGTATVTGNATVSGSTLPAASEQDMPPIDLPAIASSGDYSAGGGGNNIGSGDHGYDNFSMGSNSSVTIVGPATIVCQTMELSSNATLTVDATNGPVEFYVVGDFTMNSNTTIASTTLNPLDISLNLISDNIIDPNQNVNLDEVDFDSNAVLYGTVYAPNAFVEINSNFELFGSLIARRVHLDSNAFVHFDEALLNASGNGNEAFDLLIWRETSISSNNF
tara:strand:- start:495 stop:1748 length:1254 start_codon:yes stop_codon:yes gene_type:complete